MRVCRRFGCGWPGSIRSCRMPSLIHHTDSAVRPGVPVEANGEPCSARITSSKPSPRNGLSTNLVAFAKLRHRPQSGSLISDEAHSFVHSAVLSPRHRLILPADRELSPIHPVYSVTHLSGLDR